jgi:hypothetical protein
MVAVLLAAQPYLASTSHYGTSPEKLLTCRATNCGVGQFEIGSARIATSAADEWKIFMKSQPLMRGDLVI